MNSATLLDNFDLLAEAPGGVPKLRELILQLAVRGKLVPQEEGEVHHEGHEEHEGKKEGQRIEGPYAVPPGWRWTTLRGVSSELGQKVPDAPFTYVDVSAIDKDKGCIGDGAQVLRPEDAPSRARKIVKRGTVIYSTVRPYLLNIAVVDRKFEPAPIVSTAFFVMHPHPEVDGRFLFYYLRSQPFTEYVNGAMTGMAYPAVNDAKMTGGPFPLPPLAEQKRIAARVDELMKRCDELEARQNERNERRTVLTASCLHAVTDPKKPNPSFIIHPSSFNLLFTSPESVAELRKTILQLAVQGRLVKQEKTHHEGHEEHEGQTEGERLDAPYVLPQGWRWAAFSEIATVTGGVTKGRRLTGNTACYPYLRVANVQRGWLDLTEIKEIQIGVSELHRYALRRGDLLITEGGDWDKVGRMAVWRGEIEPCLHQNHVFRARITADAVCSDWILMYFNSEARGYFERAAKQTTNLASINMRQLRACPISLPPLAEQKRIVAKVNELMTLCDALEAKLTRSRANADALAAAVVHHLCSDVTRPKEATA